MVNASTSLYHQDFDRHGMAEKYRLVLELCENYPRILDIGCSDGALLEVFKSRGHETYGVEHSREGCRMARERGVEVQCGSIEEDETQKLLRSKGPRNALLFLDVLEHLANPWKVMEFAHDLLSPEGIVIVTLPNIAHWRIRKDLLLGRFEYRPAGIMDVGHLRFFTRDSAVTMFEEAGWRVQRVQETEGDLPGFLRPLHSYLLRRYPTLFAKVFLYVLRAGSR